MSFILEITGAILAVLSFLASLTVIIRLKQPASFVWWGIKVFVGALTLFFILTGVLSIVLGLITHSAWIVLPGVFGTSVFSVYLYRVNKVIHSPTGFKKADGADWENRLSSHQKTNFLTNLISFLPSVPGFELRQDVSFGTVPGSDRELLCDMWLPAKNVRQSGLAFIYFHGSAWVVLDKDFGTRPFFEHLASQGHVIIDVAYRLFPETDMTGMVNDVYRAIGWMKSHVTDFKISPERIVVGGASAGGHLALLAAYNKNTAFIPAELQDTDLSVHAVISEYGPSDLQAMYYHTAQHITTRRQLKNKKLKPAPTPELVMRMVGKNFHRLGMDKNISEIGVLPVILGCDPDTCPEMYNAFSPVTHVHRGCPETLIIQGSHDLITPLSAARQLYKRLNEEGVNAAMYIIPQTDHAFDLILPRISPVAHTAIYLVERFLALQACNP